MTGLQTAEPGPARCKRCGAEAAGACAGCHGLSCGDCVDLVPGAAGPIAYCVDCLERGAPRAHVRALWRVLGILVAVAVALLALVAFLGDR